MRRSVLADTGPLYAALDPDDTWHRQATEEITSLNRSGLDVVVLFSTLVEAYTLVLHKVGSSTAHGWLTEITSHAQLVNPTAEDYLAARHRLLLFVDQPLTLCDTVLATVSARLNIPVWTYDHHFDVLRAMVWRPE